MGSFFLPAFLLLASVQGFEPHVTDQVCSSAEVLLAPSPGVGIHGRCENAGESRVLHVSLSTPDPQRFRGRLYRVSLGFCGEIVDARAPAGWIATIGRKAAAFGRPAEVEWELASEPGAPGETDTNTRIEGFAIVLKPGWRRAIAYFVRWQSGGGGASSPHDCGEWPQ
jgi:hypothetical protein